MYTTNPPIAVEERKHPDNSGAAFAVIVNDPSPGQVLTRVPIAGDGAEIDVGSAVGCGNGCATGAGVLGDIGDGTGEGGVGEGEPEQPHATSIVTPSMHVHDGTSEGW